VERLFLLSFFVVIALLKQLFVVAEATPLRMTNGIPCSLIDCAMKTVIALDMVMPRLLKRVSAFFFISSSILKFICAIAAVPL
jgi:hypothetical protein